MNRSEAKRLRFTMGLYLIYNMNIKLACAELVLTEYKAHGIRLN